MRPHLHYHVAVASPKLRAERERKISPAHAPGHLPAFGNQDKGAGIVDKSISMLPGELRKISDIRGLAVGAAGATAQDHEKQRNSKHGSILTPPRQHAPHGLRRLGGKEAVL